MGAGKASEGSRGSRPGGVQPMFPEGEDSMTVKVKSVAILDDMNNVINLGDDLGLKPAPNFSTRVLGWNVPQLSVRVELAGEGVPDDEMPAQITVDVRMLEPGRRRIGKSSLMS